MQSSSFLIVCNRLQHCSAVLSPPRLLLGAPPPPDRASQVAAGCLFAFRPTEGSSDWGISSAVPPNAYPKLVSARISREQAQRPLRRSGNRVLLSPNEKTRRFEKAPDVDTLQIAFREG